MVHVHLYRVLYTSYHTSPSHVTNTRLSPLASVLRLRPECIPLLLPRKHQLIHTSHIVLRFAHISQPRPSRPLRSSPDDINSRHRRAVDLEPHLHADLHHLSSQQNSRVLAPSSDLDECARKRLAGLGRYHEYISYFGAVGVFPGEESGAGSCRVELVDEFLAEGGHGIGVGVADGGNLRPNFEFADLLLLGS